MRKPQTLVPLLTLPALVAVLSAAHPAHTPAQSARSASHRAAHAETIFVEVGSPRVDGRVYQEHTARVRVHIGSVDSPVVTEWINILHLGDSAGRPVMRWTTRSVRGQDTLELLQTYDHRTLAPLGWSRTRNGQLFASLAIDGTKVTGWQRTGPDQPQTAVNLTLSRGGFIASASDLVPLAVGLTPGSVIVAPLWGPGMQDSELRIFTIVGEETIDVEGTATRAFRVEERRYSDKRHLANWFMVHDSPYMVAGDVFLQDGRVQKMTEVALPHAQQRR